MASNAARWRRSRKRALSAVRVLVATLMMIAAIALGALGWLVMGYAEQPGPGKGKLVEVALEPQVSLRTIAYRLAGANALREPMIFELYARIRGAGARLRTGSVALYDDMTPSQIVQRIAYGFGSAVIKVVLPEGYSRFEMADRLERFGICSSAELLAATEDPALLRELGIEAGNAEGWLFPDTYSLREGTDPRALVKKLVTRAQEQLNPLFEQHADALRTLQAEVGMSRSDVLTLASIVEEEAVAAEEQPIIAGVFLNRLRDPKFTPKRLQADPTVIYGCLRERSLASCVGFNRARPKITRAMLADAQNPYNTYRIDGLPPGPIANPGISAVRAVLDPKRHDYLYFVAKGGGRHTFSATLDAHNAAVQRSR